jgi:serine/threonine protein kinase
VNILLTLQHPNIVTFMGAAQREPDLCLAFELLEGSVSNILQMVKKNTVELTWQLCLSIARQAALAVDYLHDLSPRVIHR